MTPPETQEWVWLARIRRPQGRKGEVFAEILTDFPEKFAQRRQLWLLHESATDVRPVALRRIILPCITHLHIAARSPRPAGRLILPPLGPSN